MPATVGSLPLHPLVVHAVVVLVPLSVLGAIAVALSARARARYGGLVGALATVALVSIPVATSTGEALRARLPATPAIAAHAQLADQLLPVFCVLWLALAVLLVAARWQRLPSAGPGTPAAAPTATRPVAALDAVGARVAPGSRRTVTGVAAVVAVVAAIASGVQVYRIGDSGARAVWHGVGTGPVVNPEH